MPGFIRSHLRAACLFAVLCLLAITPACSGSAAGERAALVALFV